MKDFLKKKKIALVTIICSVVTGLCAVYMIQRTVRPGKGRPYEQLTVEEAERYMDFEQDYRILDIRDEEMYRNGHLDKAVNIPYSRIVEDARHILPDSDQTVYVYGEDREQSCAGAQKLSDMGYTAIAEIGSYDDWGPGRPETESENLLTSSIE